MTPEDALAELGFQLVQESRDGSRQFARRAHRYLVFWLTARPDASAELTWEFSLGQYLRDKGFFVSGQDELSLLLFPREELTGAFDAAWVARALSETEERLNSLDFVAGT